ncbi:hypothetical protein [Acaryochloris marina]|uniref:Uncharacterized protein n=1 Tax=Acaryochloris marina (strain MBIC 11017) TaxID=329726 RepID=A8ZMC6_ACAM1|nr:hypothetical protein [Acaryochloris marina]ABW32337.1 hypothetical protein AM1_C0027 [Acaryochloris marina MBIC11017]
MKKHLQLLILTSLVSALPAKANPVADACFNSLIEHPDDRPDTAVLSLTVEHNGSQYHVIDTTYRRPQPNPASRTYIRTDDRGGCEEILSYQIGSHPEADVYRERLGSQVFDKVRQAFRQQQQQQQR